MYKAVFVVFLASILAISFSEEHFLEDDEEMTRSLDDWLQEGKINISNEKAFIRSEGQSYIYSYKPIMQ